MKERPILFSGPMVRAILEGRKTQTRRVIKKNPLIEAGFTDAFIKHPDNFIAESCPYGQPGDRLWVKEAWWHHRECRPPFEHEHGACIRYQPFEGYDKKSPLFMPRWASRLTLEITGVRVERVQDISKADVVAEGISEREGYPLSDCAAGWHEPYAALWDSLNAKRGFGWDANPWVRVIEFRLIQQDVEERAK
jgi:hypothetical protein